MCRIKGVLPNKVEGTLEIDVRKIFADSVSSLSQQLAECTAEWQLFKAAVASSAARLCARKRLVVANDGQKVTLS